MQQLKYFQIIRELNSMKAEGHPPALKIRVLSNIIVHQLAEILDFWLRKHQIVAEITVGNYDNIIQDATSIPRDEVVILFWEAANITDGFHHHIRRLSVDERKQYLEKMHNELSMVFNALKDQKKVFMNAFHAKPFDNGVVPGIYADFVGKLNGWTAGTLPENFSLIDLSGIFMKTGLDKSFDLRNFYASKALYTIDFYKAYSAWITPMVAAVAGKIKKVLILDCDNTLWGGIIGEDGKDGIVLSTPYQMVQSCILELYARGVLICLCSKNNPADVDEVLGSHPGMVLKNEHILIKKINWEDKASNIQEISTVLNLGLSSFVFVDDSDFETNLVKNRLPEVSVFQVPEKINEYPVMMEEIAHQFFRFEADAHDAKKTEQYRRQAQRSEARASFRSIEDYLRSLEIEIAIGKNDKELIPRIAQMSQKTNQFNLTTKRYTEQDVAFMMNGGGFDFFTLAVKDRYGDSGVTGLAIICHNGSAAEIDSLLLSCRVLGRNIEWVFMDEVIGGVGKPLVKARFVPTQRNNQVKDFYDRLGFERVPSAGEGNMYQLKVPGYQPHRDIDYIKVETWKNV